MKKAARKFAAGTEGGLDDIISKKSAVPAFRYDNPNPKTPNCIKLEGFEAQVAADGSVTLIDAKTKLAIFHRGAQGSVLKTLERLRWALAQNPGYKVVYEFPTESSAEAAEEFIRANRFDGIVSVRLRSD
jgi:filamentous hemagglutinin